MSDPYPDSSFLTASTTDAWKFTTGIDALDRALGKTATPGHLIGVVGCTGSGKTVLASQLIRNALISDPPIETLFLSVETEKRELWNRLLSSHCNIPFSEFNGPSKFLLRRPEFPIFPNPGETGMQAVHDAKALYDSLHHLKESTLNSHIEIDPFNIARHLNEFERSLGDKRGLVILDYLEPSEDARNSFQERELMEQCLAVLRATAARGKLLIFAFAQAAQENNGKAYLLPRDSAVIPNLFSTADCFIGIGHSKGDDEDTGRIYRKNQHLTVVEEYTPKVNVPVTTRFEFQRFEDRDEDRIATGGYLPFTRERFQELCGLSYNNGIALYLLLTLKSGYRKGDTNLGKSWHSQEGMANLTGLSVKQVRTAIKKLKEKEMISIKRSGRKTNHYTISEWKRHHTAEGGAHTETKYVRIPRYILDPEFNWLFKNSELLCLWLFLVINARVFQHSDIWDLKSGHLLLNFSDLEHDLSISPERASTLIEAFRLKGQIEVKQHRNGQIIKIVEWTDYHAEV